MSIVRRSGQFICRIKYYGFYVNLYLVDNQLVEVYYNMHSNAVEEVEIIDHKEKRLAIYAAHVDISDAFPPGEK